MCKKVVNEYTFTFEFVPDIKRMKRKILLRSNIVRIDMQPKK